MFPSVLSQHSMQISQTRNTAWRTRLRAWRGRERGPARCPGRTPDRGVCLPIATPIRRPLPDSPLGGADLLLPALPSIILPNLRQTSLLPQGPCRADPSLPLSTWTSLALSSSYRSNFYYQVKQHTVQYFLEPLMKVFVLELDHLSH